MQEKIVAVYKKCGQTPLECIDELKLKHPELKHVPMTYAGRLDPLAEGVLLILIGDECLKKDDYLALSKEYEVSILFGFSTDTYDVMGLVTDRKDIKLSPSEVSDRVSKILPDFTGRITQKYPAYSSRTVESKPLFQWAREGKLDDITVPSHVVFVDKVEILRSNLISSKKLLAMIKDMVGSVHGDFRQDSILGTWDEKLKESEKEYPILTIKVICGSGVYVRSLAHDIGGVLGIPALALHIIRTKVGDYSINDTK